MKTFITALVLATVVTSPLLARTVNRHVHAPGAHYSYASAHTDYVRENYRAGDAWDRIRRRTVGPSWAG